MQIKILFFLFLTSTSLLYAQKSPTHSVELAYSKYGLGHNFSSGYLLKNKKNEFLFGLLYHINVINKDNQNHFTYNRGWAFNFGQHWGLHFNYSRILYQTKEKDWSLGFCFDQQITFTKLYGNGFPLGEDSLIRIRKESLFNVPTGHTSIGVNLQFTPFRFFSIKQSLGVGAIYYDDTRASFRKNELFYDTNKHKYTWEDIGVDKNPFPDISGELNWFYRISVVVPIVKHKKNATNER